MTKPSRPHPSAGQALPPPLGGGFQSGGLVQFSLEPIQKFGRSSLFEGVQLYSTPSKSGSSIIFGWILICLVAGKPPPPVGQSVFLNAPTSQSFFSKNSSRE
jgi:hypothetical protein